MRPVLFTRGMSASGYDPIAPLSLSARGEGTNLEFLLQELEGLVVAALQLALSSFDLFALLISLFLLVEWDQPFSRSASRYVHIERQSIPTRQQHAA